MRTDDPFIQSVKDARTRLKANYAICDDESIKEPEGSPMRLYHFGQIWGINLALRTVTDLLRSYGINPEED